MSITKEIRNLEDLKMRKRQLREEVKVSRQALEDNISGIINQASLRKAVAGTAMSWLTAYAARLFRKNRAEARAFGVDSKQATVAGYLPIIRKVLNYGLEYLEQRYARPQSVSNAIPQAPQASKSRRREKQPA